MRNLTAVDYIVIIAIAVEAIALIYYIEPIINQITKSLN